VRFCLTPKCPKKTTGTHCVDHGGRRAGSRAAIAPHRRGYGKRWRRYSQVYLLEHPVCVGLPGEVCTKASRHVDHKQAVDGPDDPLFWEPTNHQALCATCHPRKTVKYDGGYGNPKRPFMEASS
jgi:5-methylcytosine-specific restriction protein A